MKGDHGVFLASWIGSGATQLRAGARIRHVTMAMPSMQTMTPPPLLQP